MDYPKKESRRRGKKGASENKTKAKNTFILLSPFFHFHPFSFLTHIFIKMLKYFY
jgi:hypothetical protein